MNSLIDQVGTESDFHDDQLLLPAVEDAYGGVIVEMNETMNSERFFLLLRASLFKWKILEGFRYHHAEPHYIMLVHWIPKTADTIPANASHRIGIGAIILNDIGELLVVQEKNGRLKGTGIWKIPTGVVDQGEDIFRAAIREVKEETGIDADFVDVVGLRETHNCFFGKSDIFFLCMLRPLSFKLQKQELEIEAVQWMPLEEFAAQPFVQKNVLFKSVYELCLAKKNGNYVGFTPKPIKSGLGDEISYIYVDTLALPASST
ncbi:nudix hydrolase 2-like isoform X2 [Impatiens glandulifera]|uniref:nudix hydrolase 2-like isoform X2 n=1 Tax=Impatiens glandulifera TaxID=253017 RepID=UPI001FB057B2|nr:nudix hydrolase 2-like isoform X2 [Impatiens glandulifera]